MIPTSTSPSTLSPSDKYLLLQWDNYYPGIREEAPPGYKWSRGGILIPEDVPDYPEVQVLDLEPQSRQVGVDGVRDRGRGDLQQQDHR